MEEEWKIYRDKRPKGNLWEISNFGNVKRNGVPFQSKLNRGYLYFSSYRLNTAVAKLFIPKPESNEKLEVAHKDCDPSNNRADNLEWVTHKENCNHPITRKRLSESKTGKHHTEEAKHKMSEARKGKPSWNKGKKEIYSQSAKLKMSQAKKGRHHYNNGIIEILSYECPEGFVPGRLKKGLAKV